MFRDGCRSWLALKLLLQLGQGRYIRVRSLRMERTVQWQTIDRRSKENGKSIRARDKLNVVTPRNSPLVRILVYFNEK